MMNLEVIARVLVIAGAAILLSLGILHGVLTLQDLRNPRTFTPPDLALRQAMQESTIAIDPRTNLWQAWLGFNLSHSLGLVMSGGTLLAIGLYDFPLFARTVWLECCAISIACAYLVMSIKFWFSKPAIGAAISLGCLAIASCLSIGSRWIGQN
jgi:hypothetical protein